MAGIRSSVTSTSLKDKNENTEYLTNQKIKNVDLVEWYRQKIKELDVRATKEERSSSNIEASIAEMKQTINDIKKSLSNYTSRY